MERDDSRQNYDKNHPSQAYEEEEKSILKRKGEKQLGF